MVDFQLRKKEAALGGLVGKTGTAPDDLGAVLTGAGFGENDALALFLHYAHAKDHKFTCRLVSSK